MRVPMLFAIATMAATAACNEPAANGLGANEIGSPQVNQVGPLQGSLAEHAAMHHDLALAVSTRYAWERIWPDSETRCLDFYDYAFPDISVRSSDGDAALILAITRITQKDRLPLEAIRAAAPEKCHSIGDHAGQVVSFEQEFDAERRPTGWTVVRSRPGNATLVRAEGDHTEN